VSVVYQFNPDMRPDTDYVSGELKYLLPGNEARMLDPRRTPLRVVGIDLQAGFFVTEVLDFEDRHARWELPFEWAGSFQFACGSAEASDSDVAAYAQAVSRLDKPLRIPIDPGARADSEARIALERTEVSTWLDNESRFLRAGGSLDLSDPIGPLTLRDDLRRYMTGVGLWAVEDAFAERYVSNPYAGEMAKGHSIVLAELGIVPFDGKQVRDPRTFAGPFGRDERAEHILHRLAFVREVFERLGHSAVVLYRGMSFVGPPSERSADSLTSATFSLEVARSHFEDRDVGATGVLLRQPVPVTRLFMSYLETEQMNHKYLEAEAVLLADPCNEVF
jgi:hypothetical protein